jgi:hypothetical protein
MRKIVPGGLCALMCVSYVSVGQAADVPAPLERTAECMVKVLAATPGVSGPRLGVVTSEGWAHPFVEYRADEALSRDRPIRFEARKSQDGYQFWAVKSGLGAPELHVTDAVMRTWKAQCHVYANVFFP